MKSKSQSTEVIEVEAEEIPLEQVIENALVKENITDKVISGLKEKFGNLKLAAIDDKESYLEIKQAKKEVRQWGILTEKLCKAGREDAIKIQKLWLSKEKQVLAQIAEVENPLQSEIDKYENEEERKLAEEAQRKENVYMQRQTTLLKLGAAYANGCIISEDVTYDTDTLKNTQDDIFEEVILPKYKRVYEAKEVVRIAEEKRKADAAEQLRLDQEKLTKEKRELEEARAELQKQRDESDRIRREEENRVTEAKRKIENDRLQKLMAVVPYDQIDKSWLADEITFNKILSDKTAEFEAKKKDDEQKRIAQIEIDRKAAEELAVKRERERIENERIALEQKRLREQQEEAERLEQASDKMKWANIVEYFNAAPFLEMKSNSYKTKVVTAKKKVQEIIGL